LFFWVCLVFHTFHPFFVSFHFLCSFIRGHFPPQVLILDGYVSLRGPSGFVFRISCCPDYCSQSFTTPPSSCHVFVVCIQLIGALYILSFLFCCIMKTGFFFFVSSLLIVHPFLLATDSQETFGFQESRGFPFSLWHRDMSGFFQIPFRRPPRHSAMIITVPPPFPFFSPPISTPRGTGWNPPPPGDITCENFPLQPVPFFMYLPGSLNARHSGLVVVSIPLHPPTNIKM